MTKTFQKVLKSLSNDPGIISCKNHPFSLYKCRISYNPSFIFQHTIKSAEAEFKEFEPRLKFKTRLKYGWFHYKLYSMFQELSRHSIETGFRWI